MKKVLIVLCLLFFCACSKQESLEDILKRNNYIVIDVRSQSEFSGNHIEGAINLPYDSITNELYFSKDVDLLVYCKSGSRSKIAYEKLKSFGYKVYDLGAYDSINMKKWEA